MRKNLPLTFEGEFLFLDEDPDWVPHELGGDVQDLCWHGGGQEDHLNVGVQETENVVDLILESTAQHLVSLVQNEHLNVLGLQDLTGNHVKHTTGGAWNKPQLRT